MTQMEALKAIAARDGGLLRPAAVVEEARPKDSPLHGRFEWDNRKAGEKYRLLQAQKLIREFYVEIEDGVKGRAFVNLSIDRTEGKADNPYRPVESLRDHPDLLEVAMNDALDELEALRERYTYLKALKDVWDAIDAHSANRKKGKARA